MPSRYVRASLVAVSLLLVANPFLVYPHATDPSFEYRAMELQSDGYRIPVESSITDIHGFACEDHRENWGCIFDTAIAANGSMRFQTDGHGDIEEAMIHGEPFVYRPEGLYRRVVETDNGTVTARLVPVSWEAALEKVSVERDDLSPRERRLLDERNLTTNRPIDWTGQPNPRGAIIVESNGTYHLLWEVSGDRNPPEVEALVIETARALGVGFGLLVFAVAIMLGESRE